MFHLHLGRATTVLVIISTAALFFLRSLWRWINSKEKSIAKEIILITGAAQGIGKELALQYGLQGGRIICVDVNETKNKETVQELKALNIEAYAYTCDAASFESVANLQKNVEKDIGPVSIVVCNAGRGQNIRLTESIDEKIFREIFDLNFFALFAILKFFLPGMKKRNKGHIVAIASITGLAPLPGLSAYSVSKKAVSYLMRAAREEVEITGETVHFTTVYPDFTATSICDRLKDFMPLMLTPEKVAELTIKAQKRGDTEVSIPRHYLPLSQFLNMVSLSGLQINYWAGQLEGIGNQRAWGNFFHKIISPIST